MNISKMRQQIFPRFTGSVTGRMAARAAACLCLPVFIAACDPGQPEAYSGFDASGYAAPLSQAEFNSLPPEEQYQVASKLYGTLFRGISVEDYFDMDAGVDSLTPKSTTFIDDTRAALQTHVSNQQIRAIDDVIEGIDEEGNPDPDLAKYIFDPDPDANDNEKAMQLPLARIKEYPISRDLYVEWMAYFLSNTIMFSPAFEMESTDAVDVQNMYRFLSTRLEDGQGVREIIRANLPSLARWRVSRSSENHALEAYELYLGLFETEEDSVKGGIACKDYYLTDEDSGYVISTTNYPNTEPQLILDSYFVTTCEDLYDVIAGHPLVMPRAVEVIVNYLFSGRSQEDRVNIINSIVSSGAQTFEDIFTAMIFSREYLLNTERPRTFEESLMPMLDSLKWDPLASPSASVGRGIFAYMASGSTNPGSRSNILYLGNKGWHSMSLKIGRLPDVPLDALSFANYHKSVREQLFLRAETFRGAYGEQGEGLIFDAEGEVRPLIADMSVNEYIDFLFLNVLQRKATQVERTDLYEFIVNTRDHTNLEILTDLDTGEEVEIEVIKSYRYHELTEEVFDYISRLPEFYYFKAVN